MVESSEKRENEFRTRMINKISLAPMVRMNTLPFRLLTSSMGADYVFSEEIIDKKLISCVRIENSILGTIDYVTARDYALVLSIRPDERPKFILQIGTCSPDTACQAVDRLLPDITGIDVNMGCPKSFSTSGGMGSALMKQPENAQSIMKALVQKFGDKISVSCKIRVLRTFEDTLKYILMMQEAGVNWISIHPRTAAEETRVPARWFTIKQLLDTGLIKIPVLGSGDLFSPLDIHKYLSYTGASGVIVARGAIHNPGIFRLKEQMLDRETLLLPDQNMASADENDWKDNTVEPEMTEEQKLQREQNMNMKEMQAEKKKMGSAYENESIEFSQNLVRVYEKRYNRLPMETDIMEYVKEYFKLCVQYGNQAHNTKYCILYMLKTHKHRYDLFLQIHGSKSLAEQGKYLGLDSLFEGLAPEYFLMFSGTYYKKNKHLVDKAAQEQGLAHLQQQHAGQKREKETTGQVMTKSGQDLMSKSDEATEQDGQKRVKTD